MRHPDITNARHLLRLLAQGNTIQKTPVNNPNSPGFYLWTLAGEPLRKGCLSQLLRASYVCSLDNKETFVISEHGREMLKKYEDDNKERLERQHAKRRQARYREIDEDQAQEDGET